MNSEHQDKLQQFYKFQEDIYRGLGAYDLAKNISKTKRITYELYCILILFWVGSYNMSLLIAFITLNSILDKIMKVFYVLGTLIAAMAKLIYLKRHSSLYQDLATILHKHIFIPVDEAENAIFLKHLEMSKSVRNMYGGVSCMSLVYTFVLQQFINSQELPATLYAPFDMDIKKNLIIMKVYSFISVAILCFINIAYDSWCTSFLIFTKGQLEILEHRLERIGNYSTSDLDINTELKNCIRLHAEVYELVGKLENAISFPVSLQIFCSMTVLCCNFYAISFTSIQDDAKAFVKFSIYQMAMLSQIFLICFYANEVTLASSRLSHALFSSNWITWSKVNRKLMLLTMLRFRNPIKIRSINRCFYFDLAAFTSIVNTSYSYFALLKQMNN